MRYETQFTNQRSEYRARDNSWFFCKRLWRGIGRGTGRVWISIFFFLPRASCKTDYPRPMPPIRDNGKYDGTTCFTAGFVSRWWLSRPHIRLRNRLRGFIADVFAWRAASMFSGLAFGSDDEPDDIRNVLRERENNSI